MSDGILIRRLKVKCSLCIIPLVLPTMGTTQYKLHRCSKVFNLYPVLYILMQKAEIVDTCHIVRNILAKE